MPRQIVQTQLNASTMDIMNVIRKNASLEYQNLVPKVEQSTDIPKVGEVIYGTPALANAFLNALINAVALTTVQSAVFYNPYRILKKGYLEFGERIDEIFVNIVQALEFDPEKAEAREFKRYLPDVQAAFHAMNWKVLYPVTISDDDLKQAFMSMTGVQDLIAKIVDQIYTAASYDEFLLFKYMLIKSLAHGKIVSQAIDPDDLSSHAVAYRGTFNLMPFMSSDYNSAGVLTTTPPDRLVVFMDAMYNAKFDVEVLAGAFNMSKADFMGRLFLIDNWTKFDNKRFEVIRKNSDGIEEVTQEELSLLANVKAVLMDERWFQVYDNLNKFTEKFVASGDYWNYFYHTRKTVSWSPFSNAVAFVAQSTAITPPSSVTVQIISKSVSPDATIFTFAIPDGDPALTPDNIVFIQSEALTKAGIAVQQFGALIIPASQVATSITLVAQIQGVEYTATTAITGASDVGDKITMSNAPAPQPPTPGDDN